MVATGQTSADGLHHFLNADKTSLYIRERWTTPDGDFIDVDWAGPEDAERLLVMFHGLEDNSQKSLRPRGCAAGTGQRLVVVARCRTFAVAAGSPNLMPRAYHAGDSEEADWILRRFAARHAKCTR